MDILNLINENKIKRLFRAREKISFPGACCHITQRAPGRELLFLEESDCLYMLHLIKEKSNEFNFEVFSFSLMPNHLHLQIKLNEENLSKSMKSLFEDYAKVFNKKYGRKGHVFSGAYRQALCLDDSYLLATSVYIHLNSMKAHLAKTPWNYRWSSCRLYVERIGRKSFVNYRFILKILDEDINQAYKIYRDLLKQAYTIKTKEIWEDVKVLNSFRDKLVGILAKIVKRRKNIHHRSKNWNIFDICLLDEKIKELREKRRLRTPQEIQARRYLIEQLLRRGFTKSEIAEKLGLSRQGLHKVLRDLSKNKLTKSAMLEM